MKEFDMFLNNNKKIVSEYTKKSYKNCIGSLLDYYKISTIEEYNKLKLIEFETYLNSLPIKVTSYNQHLRSLKSFSTWLYKHDFSPKNIVKDIPLAKEKEFTGDKDYDKKRQAKKKVFLTDEELERMLKASKSINEKLCIALMGYMGLRRGEVIKLKLSDINGDMLAIPGKGGSYEIREMPPVVKYLVGEYIKTKKSDSEYLIVSKVGHHQIKNSHSIFERINSIARKVGIDPEKIEYVTPHSLRRSMVCNAALQNINPYIIKDMARHKNFKTTERYLEPLKDIAANEAFRNQKMPDMSVLVA